MKPFGFKKAIENNRRPYPYLCIATNVPPAAAARVELAISSQVPGMLHGG